jgi:fatty acid desaturase
MEAAYQAFRDRVASEGLYARDYTYYALYAALCLIGVALSLYAVTLTANPWVQALNAAFLAVALVQTGMLGHDLSHGQVFARPRLNRFFAVLVWSLFGGLSESKWFLKHEAHHAHTNQLGKDPDLDIPFIFSQTQQASLPAWMKYITPHQHILFFLALPLIYLSQIAYGFRHILGNFSPVTFAELVLMSVRLFVTFYVPLAYLPLSTAILFLAINFACIGTYMSLAFAPNHKGMEVLDASAEGGWREQIILTRNVRPTWYIFQFFGGLNFQIEHHLFSNVPRTSYARINLLLRRFCAAEEIPYAETTWRGSMREIYEALKEQARIYSGRSKAYAPAPERRSERDIASMNIYAEEERGRSSA